MTIISGKNHKQAT